MTQTIQQIVPQQAVPVQTGQGTSNPAKGTDEFLSLMQSAVNAAGKNGEKPETGGKSGKTDRQEDRGGEETAQDLLRASLQADFFPFGAEPAAAAAAQAVQAAPLNGLIAAAELSPASDTAAVPRETAAGPVPSAALPADLQGPAEPALQQDTPAMPDLPAAQGPVSEGPPGPPAAEALETGPEERSFAAAAAPPERAAPEKAPAPAGSGPGGGPAVQSGGTVPEKNPEAAGTEHAAPAEAQIPGGHPLPGGGPEARASGGEAQPQKKTAAPDGGGKTSPLSDLYAGGNVVIKVSDEKAAQEPSAAGQVAQAVARQVKQGRQEFQMELYPQSLGKVSVKLSAENGVLTVEIAASNPKTQSLLLSGSDEIRSLLQSSTGQNVNVVKPEQSGAWYARQDDGGSGGYRQQEQEEKEQRESEAWRGIRSVGMSTGSFLSIMRQLAQ